MFTSPWTADAQMKAPYPGTHSPAQNPPEYPSAGFSGKTLA